MDNSLDILLTPKETKAFLNASLPHLNKLVEQGVFNKYHFPNSKIVYYKKQEIFDALEIYDPKKKLRDDFLALILNRDKAE